MSEVPSVGVLTISDRCSRGEAEDQSGTNLQALVTPSGLIRGQCRVKTSFSSTDILKQISKFCIRSCDYHPACVTVRDKVKIYQCVPDEQLVIQETLIKWCDEEKLQLILTTGGTGFSPRDVTPEAVKKVLEREAPGLVVRMITESLKVTPLAMLSRLVCGTRSHTLIITLPGSKKASEECLRFVAPAIPHAIDLIVGRTKQVDKTHNILQAEGAKYSSALHQGHHHHPHHHHHHHHGHKHLHHTPHHHHHHSHYHGRHNEQQESKADVSQVSRRVRKSPYPMISVNEAVEIVLAQAVEQGIKSVSLISALGYVLAEDIYAKDPLPPFPASIKDGYAVITADGGGVRSVVDDSTAGCSPEKTQVSSGMCVRINTGAPVPAGADAVVQVEDTELVKDADDGCTELEIKILKEPFVGQDIRPVGCDIAEGEKILEAGTLLGPSEMGLLATVGATHIMTIDKPVVAILSTGNELQNPDEPLKAGHIRDSNKTTLMALMTHAGFQVVDAGIARDDPSMLLDSLREAFSKADVIVTSGGVSMGERDILRPVLISDFSATIHFAQVFMKPGKPTTFATCEYEGRKKLILGLPGNPVSATVTATLYLLPLCRKMSGWKACENTCIKAKLSEGLHLDPRPEYHRAQLTWDPETQLPWPTPLATSCLHAYYQWPQLRHCLNCHQPQQK